MKKWLCIAALAVAVQAAGAGMASAAYVPEGDLHINLLPGSSLTLPIDTATASYELQEGVHDAITDLTGISVDHSYTWVEIGGTPILAIDPPRPMF